MLYFLLLIRREGATEYSRVERLEAATHKAAHAAALAKHWPGGQARIMSKRKQGRRRTVIGIRWWGTDNTARHDSALFVLVDPPRTGGSAHADRARAYNDD